MQVLLFKRGVQTRPRWLKPSIFRRKTLDMISFAVVGTSLRNVLKELHDNILSVPDIKKAKNNISKPVPGMHRLREEYI